MLTLKGQDIPGELQRLAQPPKQIFCNGEGLEEFLKRPRLAVVGSRKITPYGRYVTEKIVRELARQGVVIISGLALGTDSVAHASCLEAGGQTIAVLPSGLDKIYPTSHNQLAQRITANGGLLVSEYPVKTAPMQHNFVARNRIIAALAEGILIPEAAVRSGSLHTARFGLELGLPVLAVPGPINSPVSEGTNNLIKAGATPITSVEDILVALDWQLSDSPQADLHANTEQERIILELLSHGISDGHELLQRSELAASPFNQALTMLEITGRIRPLGNNHWALA